jgi:hypothetical protein
MSMRPAGPDSASARGIDCRPPLSLVSQVAQEGFEALMDGKDHVVAGSVKNKAEVCGRWADRFTAAGKAPG